MASSRASESKFETLSKFWPIPKKAVCEARPRTRAQLEYFQRADTESLHEIFNKYASKEEGGERFMTYHDFILRYLRVLEEGDYNEETLHFFGSAIDTSRDKKISFPEFQAFEALLCLPDAMYALAFQIFDRAGNGYITSDEFVKIIKHTVLHEKMPFNFESEFLRLHFGKDLQRKVTYAEFTQLIHDFHDEHALQAFMSLDKDNNGYINAVDFQRIMLSLKSPLLTTFVKENLVTVAVGGEKQRQVSYAYFMAFISLLTNVELIKKIYLVASENNPKKEITKEELLYEAQGFAQITPMEVDILFHLVGLRHQTGRVMYDDLLAISPMEGKQTPYSVKMQVAEENIRLEQPVERGILIQVAESIYRFGLGAIAGAVGATAVYPIDLVKTRLQNQRTGSMVGELMYKNSFDCFKKVLRHEGPLGLYRGLLPQIVGVAPEKAIKLTMNDLMRDKLTRTDGSLPLWAEMISGGTAGASQVIFTNPLEIVKIRLQVAGEIVGKRQVSALAVVRDLGLFGLYKGSRACFLRDISFSAIYFPAYSHAKKFFADDSGYNAPHTLLLSATMAGVPAAALPTPFDVIKTRLQVQARTGQTTYTGVTDCIRKLYKEEGGSAFWKGTPARVFRSAPQFGVTLLTYELLQRLLYVDFGGRRPEGSSVRKTSLDDVISRHPDHIGGYRLATATFDGMDTKFGLCLPRTRVSA
ncbi:electrogenic aspartate/glutamate antiporter SLC25A13, mitochondrial-like isoform X2 [Liolophura sinensis]|uniref:electrogenic aspartate/glutamate antiporter SLC25A13, mitochondrial-like isoform X2 n=1 Tax=Liolophura sinensis TaxID=3198878 RepID=UPI0031583B9F